jgi:hypothetical protein
LERLRGAKAETDVERRTVESMVVVFMIGLIGRRLKDGYRLAATEVAVDSVCPGVTLLLDVGWLVERWKIFEKDRHYRVTSWRTMAPMKNPRNVTIVTLL